MHEHAHNKSDKEQGFPGVNPNKNKTGMEKKNHSKSMPGFGMISLQLFCSLPLPFSFSSSNASENHLQLNLGVYMFLYVQNADENIDRKSKVCLMTRMLLLNCMCKT